MELTKEQKLFQSVIEKAWENDAFKKELIENPVETIEKFTGVSLNIPEGKKIVVRDQTDSSVTFINIPPSQVIRDVELNEEQLELVAGGRDALPVLDYLKPLIGCFPSEEKPPIESFKK